MIPPTDIQANPTALTDIELFYEQTVVDPSFRYVYYSNIYPETKNFYQPYCKNHNIDDAHRLFFHYKKYFPNLKITFPFKDDAAITYTKDIELIMPVDPMFVDSYNEKTELGKGIAKDSKIAIVAIARDCGLQLQDSINRIKSITTKQTNFFVYENDSADDTKAILDSNNIELISQDLNLPYLNDTSYTRTNRLAKYRNICLEWVRNNHSDADYVIVVDLDADLGFSVDGIYNSIYWLNVIEKAGGMGAYSLFYRDSNLAHYDTFAVRLNDWKPSGEADYNNMWAKNWHPLVGSDPVQMYSCFGGLGVYKTEAFLSSTYKGELGSEHVDFHKTMKESGWDMYINPSNRFFSVYEANITRK